MKSKVHSDGVRRIGMNITIDVTVGDLAIYALDALRDTEDAITVLETANKREIFALARHSLESRGRDTAPNMVPHAYTVEDIARAETIIGRQYPELG
jgi:hypothetical protein